jgi:hypothetical protein
MPKSRAHLPPEGLAAEYVAAPIANAMVALPTDMTMFRLTEFTTVTPTIFMVLAPIWPGINGNTRNPDGDLGLSRD